VSTRLGRARTQSLCGTARGIASRKTVSEQRGPQKRGCRYAAIWTCNNTEDCSRRMSVHRRISHGA
jgi:hypothetical protein